MRKNRNLLYVVITGLMACVPLSARAQPSPVTDRLEKLEERMRDAESRLAKVERMVNAHSAHGAAAPQIGNPAMPQGGKAPGGMMDDDEDMMGMTDPTTPGAGQPASPPMGGGGMGGHM
jgi:hypothetical protein